MAIYSRLSASCRVFLFAALQYNQAAVQDEDSLKLLITSTEVMSSFGPRRYFCTTTSAKT